MDNRTIAIALLVLFLAPIALAESVEIVSPANGATVDPTSNGFSIRTYTTDQIKDCTLFINDEPKKTLTLNDNIAGRNIWFGVELPNSTGNWSVMCRKNDNTTMVSETRTFTAKTVESPVTVKSSGVFRGSMAYDFKFKNSPDQEPVVVKKLAAGDFLWITLNVPPSNIKKELYVTRFATESGKKYLYLEDLKKKDTYKILEGGNATVNITPSSIVIKYVGVELNRATVAVYPTLSDSVGQTETPATPETPIANNATNGTTETAGTTPPPKDEGNRAAAPTGPKNDDAPKSPPEKGVFSRFVSWLASLFGA